MRPFFLSLAFLLTACTVATPTPAPVTLPVATAIPNATVVASTSAALTNDFTPPVGRPVPPAPRESPGEFRLLAATSADGKVFQPTGQLIMDQSNVPDLIWGDNGWLYLYFMGWHIGDQTNVMAAAISPDQGQTWYFKTLTFAGNPNPHPAPVDPDIVRLADGTFRLYATMDLGQHKLGIVYMDSADGLHFGEAHTAFTLDTNVIDSTTFQFGDTWRMLVLDSDKPEQWHATSTAGEVFTLLEKPRFIVDGKEYILANGVPTAEGYQLYGFSIPANNFRTFTSSDGVQWQVAPEIPLAHDPHSALESQLIKDPAVIQLPAGGYLMVYVSKIP